MPKLLQTDFLLPYFLIPPVKIFLGPLFQGFKIPTLILPTLHAPVASAVIANAILQNSRKPPTKNELMIIVGFYKLEYSNNLEKEVPQP